jgi:hypothetical protein
MSFLALLPVVNKVLDRVLPDDAAKAEAKLKLLALQQSGEADLLSKQLSAIVAEAQSPDPWTSRARPSFLYVMYALILWAIPMGLLSAFRPDLADAITGGMTGYLGKIPEPLYMLFGTGYLGYTAARQYGKAKGSDK